MKSSQTTKPYITGVQQIGIGVKDLQVSKHWYKNYLGMEVQVFDDQAEAPLMTKYTGGEVHSRHALLSINIAGGGGMEVWQYVSRVPQPADFALQIGDLGIFAAKVKSNNIQLSHTFHTSQKLNVSEIFTAPNGEKHYWLKDLHGNWFNVIEGKEWFKSPDSNRQMGGVCGAVVGVSDMDTSIKVYRDVLGLEEVVYDSEGIFEDLPPGENKHLKYRRVKLRKKGCETGAFSRLLGGAEIELVKVYDREPKKIFENRYWGDLGFIHLCFDVIDMHSLKQKAQELGFPFTVDSADSFSMGQAAGRFAYLEDCDGTLIELVETHKVPILKKMGWYLDIKKRGVEKPLPNWMIRCMALSKVK